MVRYYEELECGCMISCDGGGGLIPCSYDKPNPNCKADEYMKNHPRCKVCGECKSCSCSCPRPPCPQCAKRLDWCPSGHYVCYECGWQSEGCDYPSPDDVEVTYVKRKNINGDENMNGNEIRIRKVKILGDRAKKTAIEMGLKDEDLVLVTIIIEKGKLPEYRVEKIEGSPIEFLQKRAGLVK